MKSSAKALIQSPPPSQTIYAGFSGGLDSTVLLHALKHEIDPARFTLNAIHVHHGLHPYADHWAAHCLELCQRWGIALNIVNIHITDTGRNLEHQAREARYRAFSDMLKPGDCLALAHHQNDVAETLLLRLMRGSGTEALGNMREIQQRGHYSVWRPLLHYSRPELEQYAQAHQLDWIEDGSNADVRFDRNFIRHRILPELEQRFPSAAQRLAHSASLLTADADLLQPRIEALVQQCADGGQLDAVSLRALEPALQAHVIRHWLEQHACALPGAAALTEFIRQLAAAQSDDDTQLACADYALRIWNGRIFLVRDQALAVPAEFDLAWDGMQALALPRGGSLRWQGNPHCATRVTYRRGGERILLAGRTQSQSVKKLLSSRVAPWLRDSLPFVYNEQGELLAVADVLSAQALHQLQPCTLIWQAEP
ncbi:MAG: tRNA lysidine(34) synthetase TilS [Arenimonas sp.]|nr:tRNA lysidine(34) synthetase TilS [Arenimonas sp.]